MRARIDGRAWLLAPSLLVLLIAFIGPVGWLLSRAFTQPTVGFENFLALWTHPIYLRVIGNTVMISAIVTPICILLGFPMAHAITYAGPRLRRTLIFIVLLPFWTSLLVRTFATLILLERDGPLNQFLLGIGLISHPLPMVYNLAGLLIGAVQVLLPFVIFPLHAAMLKVDPALLPAALTLGARPARAFLRVYLPLTLPGLMTGATLVFISVLGYFVTPAMLGGVRQLMVAQLIQDQIGEFGNWGLAGALALIILVVTALLLGLLNATVGLKAVAR